MNHHKEPDISEVDDDLDGMTDDLILERRPEPTNTIPKNIGTGFHTFTLDDVKVTAWLQRIQDFYTLMVTKNLFEREKYMILSKFTSRFSDILRDWWTTIDTDQRREKLRRQLFEMKCISFDRDIIDIHFQKMARIYFELDGDSSLKQAFVLSLPKILVGHAMTIIEDKFKSITIPHIDYVRQAIFQALDSICTKRFVLKHVVQNNPALDKACSRSDLVTKSDCSCSSHRARRKIVNRDDDLESIFSLEDEPTSETLFSIDVYEMASDDTNIDDDPSHNMYQISNTKIVDFPREVDTSHVQLAIYSSKWDKDVHNFSTPSKEILTTKLITKHLVIIEFFPRLQFRTKLIGSAVPGRDLIIGFDIYTQLKDRLEIRTKGITFRQQFKPYTSMSKLFQISGDEERIGNPINTVFMFKKPRINPDEMAESRLDQKFPSIGSFPSLFCPWKMNITKEFVLPSSVSKRVSVEAGSPLGWKEYVGDEGIVMGIDDLVLADHIQKYSTSMVSQRKM
ncbi:hypothetical protein KY285_000905 [Solanum tuberosum]|nr:hypothetical protein KY285_000905 [Solanum tuberosum]